MDKLEYAKQIAERIKELASRKGVTVRQSLRACGASPDFVNFLANRGHIPKADKFIPLADFFGVSVDCLMGHKPVDGDSNCVELMALAKCAFDKLGMADEAVCAEEKRDLREYLEAALAAYQRLRGKSKRVEKVGLDKGLNAMLAGETAERIRALSRAKGVTVKQALNDCGLHLNFVNNMSGRGSMPPADKFLPLADYFGVSVDCLLGHEIKDSEASCPEYSEAMAIIREAFAKLGF
jgi:transcriptional regulator with XRE-family HTH domain